MTKPLNERIEEANYDYCTTDQYPTAFSGFKAGANKFYSAAIKDVCEWLMTDEGRRETRDSISGRNLIEAIKRRFKEGK